MPGYVLIAAAFSGPVGAGHVGRALAVSEALSSMGVTVCLAVDGELDQCLVSGLGNASSAPIGGVAGRIDGDQLPPGLLAVVVDGYSPATRSLMERIPPATPCVTIGIAASTAFKGGVAVLPGFVGSAPRTLARSVLRGPDFVPIRQDVRDMREFVAQGAANERETPHLLSVVLGGTDATGLRAAVCNELGEHIGLGRQYKVFPESHEHVEDSHASARDGQRAVVGPTEVGLPARARQNFLESLVGSSFVLSAAGTTAWELAHLGVPFGLIRVVPNQESTYWGMTSRGWAEAWGSGRGLGHDGRLAWLLKHAERRPCSVRLPAIDGKGASRIAEVVMRSGA